jgi:hypothetical protein
MTLKSQVLSLAVVAIALLSAASSPAAQPQPDLGGKYQCTGSNPDGTRYSGMVTITPMGGAWRIDWTVAGSSHGGVGLVEGNVFSACWNIRGTRDGGVTVYRIEGGRLVGQWSSTKGNGSVGDETLTRVNGG